MEDDDARTNKVLPEIGQRLDVDEILGIVTVTRIELTSLLDGIKYPTFSSKVRPEQRRGC
jgi:hypothetical protein